MAQGSFSAWDKDFGTGINAFNSGGFPLGRISSQGVERITQDAVFYRDSMGRRAVLGGLSPEEIQVLRNKHGL